MHRIATTLLAIAWTSLGSSLASPSAPARARALATARASLDDTESLQQFLERMRAERELAFESSRKTIADYMQRLEANPKAPSQSAEVRAALVKLGPGISPLLVPYLDPGTVSGRGEIHRAAQVVLVLKALASDIVTSELIEQAQRGTPTGRCNAIEALGGCPESARTRVVESLYQLYAEAIPQVRSMALTVLAQLGGERVNELFLEALSESDDELVEAALSALTKARNETVAPRVLEFSRKSQASAHVLELMQYYLAVPQVVRDEHVLALLRAIDTSALASKNQRTLLEQLRRLEFSLDRDIEAQVRRFMNVPQADVIQAARILLAAKGERGVRRELLEVVDDLVDENKNWPQAYAQRGDLYFQLGDYRLALKDYRQAIKLSRNNVDVDVQIAIARCLALQGKFKDAATELNSSSVSIRRLKELGQEAEFLEMARDPRYRGSVFRLEDLEEGE